LHVWGAEREGKMHEKLAGNERLRRLADACKLELWQMHGGPVTVLVAPWDAVEEAGAESLPELARRLGVEDEDLYVALAELTGCYILPEEPGDSDETGEAIPVTCGLRLADVLRTLALRRDPERRRYRHPHFGLLPEEVQRCAGCGRIGSLDPDATREWAARLGIDVRGDVLEVRFVGIQGGRGRVVCTDCIERDVFDGWDE